MFFNFVVGVGVAFQLLFAFLLPIVVTVITLIIHFIKPFYRFVYILFQNI